MKTIRPLFWDFDGTLYQSYPKMLQSSMRALHDMGLHFPQEEVLKLIKINVSYGLRVCAQRSGADADQLIARFYVHHHQEKDYPPFEGMQDCLRTLHAAGVKHYLYTHRNMSAVRQLQQDGLWELFSDAVTKEDPFPRKPEPDALLALMARNGLSPEECAMVGDRDVDIEAGHNAGMRGILFDPEGYYPGCPCDLQIDSLSQLPEKLL